jgi:hypothetical protein
MPDILAVARYATEYLSRVVIKPAPGAGISLTINRLILRDQAFFCLLVGCQDSEVEFA